MLITQESPFRSLPIALNKRQLRMLNGIRYSIEMYDVAYRNLVDTLSPIDRRANAPSDFYPSVLLHAWSMVDSANRLRLLLQHTPGLPKRPPQFKVNFRKLEVVENLRNSIQHLNDEITARAEDVEVEPVWGSLSWGKIISAEPPRALIFMMLPGSIESMEGHPIKNIAGKGFNDAVDHIELTAYGTTISLSEIYRSIAKHTKLLEGGLQTAFDSDERLKDRLGSDLILTIEIAF
jgi:hypothetical protein